MEKSSSASERTAEEERHRVRLANEDFYKAFQNLNLDEMAGVWRNADHIKCVHPGADLLAGRQAVMKSWDELFSNTLSIRFHLSHISVDMNGDLAWVTLQENVTIHTVGGVNQGVMIATNIFERADNRWQLIHHHSAPSPLSFPARQPKQTLH